ncbi:MAG: DUF411 domain-containing protein [Dehalococcoidia bacterium]
MQFLRDRRSPIRRFGLPLLTGGLLAILALVVITRVGDRGAGTHDAAPDYAAAGESPAGRGDQAPAVITVYSSPTCGCCHGYEEYLEENGFEVEPIRTEAVSEMKDELNIPEDMRSCHTAKVGEYFIEGHVPVEAIWKLLEEQPQISGIALPGMPLGSAGMGGDKEQPFTIYAIVDGESEEFLTL